MNVLVVAAHPDDEILGCGGVIAKHSKNGAAVFLCILGEGVTSRDGFDPADLSRLKKNMNDASRKIGVKKILHHSLPDQKFDTLPLLEIVKKIEQVIKETSPEIVYIHSRNDLNRDHRIACEASMVALRPIVNVGEILSFETLSSTDWGVEKFQPNVYVDITNEIETKIRAMKEYKNELREYPHPRSIEGIKALAMKRGMESNLHYAESFELVRKVT